MPSGPAAGGGEGRRRSSAAALQCASVTTAGEGVTACRLRLRLRNRRCIDDALLELLLNDLERGCISGHRIVEKLLLDIERAQIEVIGGKVRAH